MRRIGGIIGMWLGLMAAAFPEDIWENDPIRYSASIAGGPVSALADGINNGSIRIDGRTPLERLRWILKKLDVPEESQVLVFSKTSKQNSLISPRTPRALYFSPDTYVGYVPGGLVEVVSHDPVLGPVFHTIRIGGADELAAAERVTSDCLSCHGTARTLDVPGVMVRSVFPDADGRPLLVYGSKDVTDATPLQDRWGGYYVTGHSTVPHLGNRVYREDETPEPATSEHALESVADRIMAERYPRATSDIVALLVLEHQCRIYNLITAASYRYRRMQWMEKLLNRDGAGADQTMQGILGKDADEIAAALLFQDFTSLGDGVVGSEAFQSAFAARFPSTPDKRSLADFHLGSKLFKHRCSYMVYSEIFRSMPETLKQSVIGRLKDVLRAGDPGEKYAYLGASERSRIDQILTATLKGYQN